MFPDGSSKFFYRTKPSLIFKTRSLSQRTPTNFGLCANHRLLGRARFFSSNCIRELRRDGPDPYHYTSGRWLRKDAIQQESRFLHFDFDALCSKVLALCPNSTSITSYDKKEGGFNRVFIFHTDSAERIVARLPFGSAGPPRLSTNSEVATIKYLQAETEIPIPKILGWSDNPSNPIGSEYIIMEHAPGIRLLEKWPTMDMDQQIRFAGLIAKQLAEMANIKFPAYGSLYFADTPYLPPSKLPFNEQFCIGPHCGHMYWNCMPIQPKFYNDVKPNQGPWTNLADYTDGLIDSGISRIPPLEPAVKRPRYKGSIETHKSLLKEARTMLKEMSKSPKIQSVASPAMFHPSLDKRNIFVSEDDPTIVTSIIDWQSTSIEPAFWYANQFPDFTHPPPDIFDFLDSNPLISARARAYHISLRIFATNFSTARSMEESHFWPFQSCQRTWEDGAASFRQDLIEASEVWKDLEFASKCPFSPPLHDELAVHKKDHRRFKGSQELLDTLVSLLNVSDEGWVPLKDWEDTKVAHQKAFRDFLQEVHELDQPDDDDPIQSEDDLRELWPFDLEE